MTWPGPWSCRPCSRGSRHLITSPLYSVDQPIFPTFSFPFLFPFCQIVQWIEFLLLADPGSFYRQPQRWLAKSPDGKACYTHLSITISKLLQSRQPTVALAFLCFTRCRRPNRPSPIFLYLFFRLVFAFALFLFVGLRCLVV